MKKNIYIFALILSALFFTNPTAAQHIIKGQVATFEGKELAGATVNAFSDSTHTRLIGYSITKKGGFFELKAKTLPVWVKVSNIGYKKWEERIDTVPENLYITLENESQTLSEIIVKHRYNGVSVVGDTIKFNTNFFKNGTETTVSDVLKKLPGINVSKEGAVEYDGKTVDYVLVDGKDLFSKENSGMAINNMAASMMIGAEIWKNYHSGKLSDELNARKNIAVNIKTEQKIKITGNSAAYGGFKDKAGGKASLISLYDKLSGTALASGNNYGNEVISFTDYSNYITTAEKLDNGATSTSLTETEAMMINIPEGAVKNKSGILAVSTKYKPTPKLTQETSIVYSGSSNNDSRVSTETYLDKNEHIKLNYDNTKHSRFLNIKIAEEWQPNKNLEVSNTSKLSLFNGDNQEIVNNSKSNINNHLTFSKYKNFRLTNYLSINKKTGNGILYGKVNYGMINGNRVIELHSNSEILPRQYSPQTTELYKFRLQDRTKELTLDLISKIGYKSRINHLFSINSYLGYNLYTYKNKSDEQKTNQRELLDFNEFVGHITLNRQLKNIKISLSTDLMMNFWNTNTAMSNGNKAYILPSLNIEYELRKIHRFELSVSRQLRKVDFTQISSIPSITRYDVITGNTQIRKPYYSLINYSIHYRMHNFNSQTIIGAYANYKKIFDSPAIISKNIGDYYINRYTTGRTVNSVNGFAYLNQGLSFIPVDLNADLSLNNSSCLVDIDNQFRKNDSFAFTGGLQLTSRFKSRWNFEMGGKYSYNNNKLENSNWNFSTKTWSIGNSIKYAHKKIAGVVSIRYNKTESHVLKTHLWDIGFNIRYKIKKFNMFITGDNLLNLNGYEMTTEDFLSFYYAQTIYKKMAGNIMIGISYQF